LEIEAFRITAPTPGQIVILIILAVIVSIAFVIAARRMGPAGTARKKKARAAGGWSSFYQIAKMRGLTKEETEVLRRIVTAYGLTKPTLVFNSINILDGCIQRAIRRVSMQELKGESKDDLINMYYRLRNKIVRARSAGTIPDTSTLPIGASVRVEIQGLGFFTTNIVRNEPEYLGLKIPNLPPGRLGSIGKRRVKVSYWRPNDAVYVFETKVKDVLIEDDVQCICLKHTDKVRRIQKRRYLRKSVRMPVLYTRLRVYEEGGKKKAVLVRKDSHWGTITDISVGGLSIETMVPFEKDTYMRIEFEIREDYKIIAIGKVRRIERNSARKMYIMHIQFTKIEKKDKNEIFALLYNYQMI